jgi:glutamine---fructose-6-phosphate transaminase (isomerizing)
LNPYISDLLAQPSALRNLLKGYPRTSLNKLGEDLRNGKFERIIVTGMGSSMNAAYPAVIQLSNQPVPVQWVNAAELLHYMFEIIGSRSLLWMNSQSGRSAELVHLLDHLTTRSMPRILTFVNDDTSPMASRADMFLNILAGPEATVSTKTYINMLAVNLLAAMQMTGGNIDAVMKEFLAAAEAMETYLVDWQTHIEELDKVLGEFDQLYILGRGTSMSAVWNGCLINKEAAKSSFEGMQAADFRHGPLELVTEGFVALIFAGSNLTADLNRNLGSEIIMHGGRVLWVDSTPDPEFPTLLLPKTSDFARPLVEILPLQMLTLVMANRKGLSAGQFRTVGKVTERE